MPTSRYGVFRSLLESLAPVGSRPRTFIRSNRERVRNARSYARQARGRWWVARTPRGTGTDYEEWLNARRVKLEELELHAERARLAEIPLAVDCLVLADGDSGRLRQTLRSLRSQTFGGWRATVTGNGATTSFGDESRIRFGDPDPDEAAAAISDGKSRDFLLVVEAGDVLEPDLMFNVVARAWDDPLVDLVHWDDDVFEPRGRVGDPRFRPTFSPEMLLSANYLGRSFAVRRGRARTAGGLPASPDDAGWWDFLLRLDLSEQEVARVPRVLQHLRRRPKVSGPQAVQIVQSHLERRGINAVASDEGSGVRVRWMLDAEPRASIVILTRSRETLLSTCLDALARTDYPRFEVVVVDSGDRDAAAKGWYEARAGELDLDLRVVWWEGIFNYSAANNAGAAEAKGEVLVFLNDDTEPLDPGWLSELVGWATRPEIGLAGLQLIGRDGRIQHGGVVIGMSGFADHLFAGMAPGSETLIGNAGWYRNLLSVTAACVAVERDFFEAIGGFDERFVLNGSDVVLGLDARRQGRRNVCSPHAPIRHLEAETRGAEIPPSDFFASYWRYQRWLRVGDPYYSPNLSLQSTVPRLRAVEEPESLATVGTTLNREFGLVRQKSTELESLTLARECRADKALVESVQADHGAHPDPLNVRTVNWFVPGFETPFYGGINTALRIADHLARAHGVENRFIVIAHPNEPFVRSALAAVFPALEQSRIAFVLGGTGPELEDLPLADVAIATHWDTVYRAAHFPHTQRRFYLIQDFEPMFYPAGTNYALAEQSYRMGFYGLCNTEHMLAVYRRYGGEGIAFMPAVDGSVFHHHGRRRSGPEDPVTVFTYARPGIWRNCWELASEALLGLKGRLGEGVRLLTAGSWGRPDDLGRGIEHLGLLDYRDTGRLYRSCDIGVALTVSEHPSYLPLELLACGVPVVAFDNPAGDWILRHERNSLLCPTTVDGLRDALERLCGDPDLRRRLADQGVKDIASRHGDWDTALAGIYAYLCNPLGALREPTETPQSLADAARS